MSYCCWARPAGGPGSPVPPGSTPVALPGTGTVWMCSNEPRWSEPCSSGAGSSSGGRAGTGHHRLTPTFCLCRRWQSQGEQSLHQQHRPGEGQRIRWQEHGPLRGRASGQAGQDQMDGTWGGGCGAPRRRRAPGKGPPAAGQAAPPSPGAVVMQPSPQETPCPRHDWPDVTSTVPQGSVWAQWGVGGCHGDRSSTAGVHRACGTVRGSGCCGTPGLPSPLRTLLSAGGDGHQPDGLVPAERAGQLHQPAAGQPGARGG